MKPRKTLSIFVACMTLLAAVLSMAPMVNASPVVQQRTLKMKLSEIIDAYAEENPAVRSERDERLVQAQSLFSTMSIDEINGYIDGKIVLLKAQAQFSTMSIDELNNYIDEGVAYIESLTKDNKSPIPTNPVKIEMIESLWIAAAMIASLAGYPCAAKLIINSVYGESHIENTISNSSNDFMSSKIAKTDAFTDFMIKVENGKLPLGKKGSFAISKKDNADLFYALHRVDCTPTKSGYFYNFVVEDKFDFDYMQYDNGFTSLINNWAYLCQHANALKAIRIAITFKKPAYARNTAKMPAYDRNTAICENY